MLSNRVKYGIHALLYLYEKQSDSPISAKKIAEAKEIPFKFLENILQELKQSGVITSQRGPAGGYRFLKDPNEVSVASIMRIIDGPIALTTCTSENFYEKCHECVSEKNCEIRHLFRKLREQMLPILEMSIVEMADFK